MEKAPVGSKFSSIKGVRYFVDNRQVKVISHVNNKIISAEEG